MRQNGMARSAGGGGFRSGGSGEVQHGGQVKAGGNVRSDWGLISEARGEGGGGGRRGGAAQVRWSAHTLVYAPHPRLPLLPHTQVAWWRAR